VKQFKILILSICCAAGFLSSICYGSHVTGNGGIGFECHKDGKDFIWLLDDYEWSQYFPDQPIYRGPPTFSVEQMVTNVLDRVRELDLQLYYRYLSVWTIFKQRSIYVSATDVPYLLNTRDTGDVVYVKPDFCVQVQIAVQKGLIFYIDKDIWNLMERSAQAGLVLHEIIYYDALRHGYQDSWVARHINSLISSQRIESMEPREFRKLISALDLR